MQAPFEKRFIGVSADEWLVNEQALQALAQAGGLYQRAGELVRVCRVLEDVGLVPRIDGVPAPWLRERLSKLCEFVGERGRQHPPDWCVSALLVRDHWEGIPHLKYAIEYPVLRPDGTVLQTPGHDRQTYLLYEPSSSYPPIPEQPTFQQAAESLERLLDLVCDFPFAQPVHRAAWLAGVLTLFARHAYTGPSPLFLVDGNVRGAGKGMLCDVAALIATGRRMPTTTQAPDEAEERKRITAIARAGDPLMLIDNIDRPFGNGALDSALTSTIWKERLLGQNSIQSFPLATVWWGTGNNVQFKAGADTARRTVHIRLLSPEQNPEARTTFKYPNLRTYIHMKRPQLVADALTLLRCYQTQRGPGGMKLRSWGSFEGWSEIVRETIVWAGLPDPIEAHEQLTQMADVTATGHADLVHGWRELCDANNVAEQGCTTREAVEWLAEDFEWKARTPGHRLRFTRLLNGITELCKLSGHKLPDARELGYTMRRFRGRVVDGLFLETAGKTDEDKGGGQQWVVKQR